VYCAISTEERNVPTVTLVNTGFASDAQSAASGKGMSALRTVATTVPCESSVMDDIESGVNGAMEAIIAALTRPLSAEEKSPKPKEKENLGRIVFKGNLADINKFFYVRGWGDGLPLIPPTEAAVEEMLTGTDLPRDHMVAKIIPRMGKATIEKIAINAVMAGALPTYMPVLIAGVQALMEPMAGFGTFQVSTGSWAPFYVLNGPVRNDLNINNSTGALSPGNIANSAIGRAMALIVKNIGGARKGIEDMGVIGNPGKYSLVIAENEEESPWQPLQTEFGFGKDDNVITVSFPNSFTQLWPYGSDDEGILRALVYNLVRSQGCTLIITPPHARTLAGHGWTKDDIRAFISQYARMPAYRHPQFWGTSNPLGGAFLHKDRIPMRETDEVQVFRDPGAIRIIVGGGAGAFVGVLSGGGVVPGGVTSKKINLPVNWNKLVAKYKNMVPTYVKY
jgi:hypothetical protein